MTQLQLPAESQTLVIQRVLYTASQLYNGTAMLQLLFRCLVSVRTKLVFSQFYISLSLSVPSDPVCDTALCDVMFFAGPTGDTKIVLLFCRSPRCKKQQVSETPVTSTKKFTAVLLGAFAQSRKSPVSFVVSVRLSVRLSASISTNSTVQISV